MGITRQAFNCLNQTINKYSKDTSIVDVIELGIQESVEPLGFHYLRDSIGKNYRSYISLDLHNVGGATLFDLSEKNPSAFNVDIITNIGTTEHVEYEDGQYNCWYNIHNWLKVGGISIHEIPEVGSWGGHCRYYTNFEFFNMFKSIGYNIIELENHVHPNNGNLNWCVMEKVGDANFVDIDTFYRYMNIDKSTSLSEINKTNNPKNLK